MECMFSYGGSRKHKYVSYKTLLLRRTKYRCEQCGNTITEWEHINWKEMHKKIGEIICQRNSKQ